MGELLYACADGLAGGNEFVYGVDGGSPAISRLGAADKRFDG
jgi:hypothetical protein